MDVTTGTIRVRGLDLLHDTPVLDIKPYIPAFDAFPGAKAGWLDDIHRDSSAGRDQGYQKIVCKRGARSARCWQRQERAKLLQQLQEGDNVIVNEKELSS